MSFKANSISAIRFSASPTDPFFSELHLEKLRDRKAGRQRIASEDGTDIGWTAGRDVLDTKFEAEKNIIDDSLHFEMRITRDALPGDLMKAYYAENIDAMVKEGMQVGAKRRKEAKDQARERLEEEAKDGRFKKHRLIPVMWDRKTRKVYFGNASTASIPAFCSLFSQTFGFDLELDTAGMRAMVGGDGSLARNIEFESLEPAIFNRSNNKADYAWFADGTTRDWLGNEFLLWLWWVLETDTDTIKLADDSDVTIMLARNLKLDCPRGQTGHETFNTEGPTRLPESRRAIQAGKMPRRVGFTMVRHDNQYEFMFGAEIFSIGAAKVRIEDDVTEHAARILRRIELWRELDETLDLLYDHFCSIRLGDWEPVRRKMVSWLAPGEIP